MAWRHWVYFMVTMTLSGAATVWAYILQDPHLLIFVTWGALTLGITIGTMAAEAKRRS